MDFHLILCRRIRTLLLLVIGLWGPLLLRLGGLGRNRIKIRELFVGIWVSSLATKFFAQVSVPIVLDLVIGSTGKPSGYK